MRKNLHTVSTEAKKAAFGLSMLSLRAAPALCARPVLAASQQLLPSNMTSSMVPSSLSSNMAPWEQPFPGPNEGLRECIDVHPPETQNPSCEAQLALGWCTLRRSRCSVRGGVTIGETDDNGCYCADT